MQLQCYDCKFGRVRYSASSSFLLPGVFAAGPSQFCHPDGVLMDLDVAVAAKLLVHGWGAKQPGTVEKEERCTRAVTLYTRVGDGLGLCSCQRNVAKGKRLL